MRASGYSHVRVFFQRGMGLHVRVRIRGCVHMVVCVCVCLRVSASVCGYVCRSLVCKCVFHRYYGRPACWQMHEKVFSRFPMLAMFSHVHIYGFITLLRPRVRIRA